VAAEPKWVPCRDDSSRVRFAPDRRPHRELTCRTVARNCERANPRQYVSALLQTKGTARPFAGGPSQGGKLKLDRFGAIQRDGLHIGHARIRP
jgi:hypothetical protein